MEEPLNPPLETVYIQSIDGTRLGPFDAWLEPSKALIWEVTLNAGAGDTLEHRRADGSIVRYVLTNTHFQPKMIGVEAHYTLRWRSE